MKMRKTLVALLIAICMIISIYTLGVFAEGINQVTASTNSSIAQGSYGYCYVYLEDLTDLASLTVAVHYDTDKVTVINSYNQVACTLYDSSNQSGCLQYSYIFDGEGSNTKTQLFYFRYQVNSTAEAGNTYFDIVVSDAYTAELETVNISGSRCAFTITEQAASQKSCSIYSSSSVSTSVEEEFTLSYRLSTYQIASGSFTIQYDPELFEFVELTKDSFLNNKVVDVNPALSGAVSVSFVGTAYANSSNLVTVKFRTLKNVAQSSEIKLTVIDFYDLELNSYSCSGYTSKVNITFDETYTEDAPSMYLSSAYNAETSKVTLTVKLEKNSHLGAGDFVLNFDSQKLIYVSSEKGFAPAFFNINDSHVTNGILKFSIISLSDITDEQVILTVVFEAKHYCQDKTADFKIGGSGLTDSLVNTIPLNFVDSSVIIPLKHTASTAVEENRVEPTCVTNGSYNSVVYCSECGTEFSREVKTIDKLGHDYSTEWTVDVAPTCTETGIKSHHCSRCGDKADVTPIPMSDHAYGDWYVIKTPTCIEIGTDEHKCSVCQHTETRTVNALGHTNSAAVVENEVDATCTADGSYDSVVYCSVCEEELSRVAKIIEKLGHNYSEEWETDLEATCTTAGSKSHHCTRCGDKADVTPIPMSDHTYGDWYVIKTPTCIETGTEEHKCSVCQHTETRTVNALGHTNSAAIVENKVDATCTADGSYDSVVYCSVCEVELSRVAKIIEKLEHNYSDNWKVDIAPTCTVAGQERRECDNCDHYETRVAEALGHDNVEHQAKAPTCTEVGWGAYVDCSRCDYSTYVELPSNGGHVMGEWTQTIAPGNESKGEERRDCANCDHYETREVEALGYLQEFVQAVKNLSNNESVENTYSELYSVLQLYSKLTDDEKQEATEEFLVLQAAINAYNSKAEMANTELKNATEIAFIPISASFTFLAALWFLLKKKFWIK